MSLMETILTVFHSALGSYGLSIILLSIAVNTIISPFYSLADLWQREEQDILKRMKKRSEEIKAVFKGDERHFYLRTLYRHNGYSPFMSIRSSFGLLIQIPFFMAAYNFLSHFTPLEGSSFLIFTDLSQADHLLGPINIMPFVMTGINIIASLRFTKGQTLRSRIQLFGMAGLFLVLLYNSASGLLLYWTCNNIFSMVRIFLKDSSVMSRMSRLPGRINRIKGKIILRPLWMAALFVVSFGLLAFLFVTSTFLLDKTAILRTLLKLSFLYMGLSGSLYFLSRYKNNFSFQINALVLMGIWFIIGKDLTNPLDNRFFPYFYLTFTVLLMAAIFLPFLGWVNGQLETRKLLSDGQSNSLMKKSLSSLMILALCVIPLLLLNNVPGEILLHRSDYFNMLVWGVLYLFLIPLFLYNANSSEYRKPFSIIVFILLICSLVNFLIFTGHYGFINDSLQFSEEIDNTKLQRLLNLFVMGLVTLFVCVLIIFKKIKWIVNGSNLILLLLISLSLYSYVELKRNSASATPVYQNDKVMPEIAFSRTEPNTVVLMLDRALGGSFQAVLEAAPELEQVYSGFTWYKNTISYGNCTIIGLPALLGGYDYTPLAMLKRPDLPVNHKVMEAWTVLPKLFLEMGSTVYISDPSNSAIDSRYKGPRLRDMDVTVSSLHGKYTNYWLHEHLPELSDPHNLLQRGKSFFMFSIFRMAPSFLREILYDNGVWFSGNPDKAIREKTSNWPNFMETLKPWSTLEYLPELSYFQEQSSFSFIYNMATHEPGGIDGNYQLSPKKINYSSEDIEHFGSEGTASYAYTDTAVMKKVGEWLQWMKDNDVYDNTQIVIVADHGREGVYSSLIPLADQKGDGIPFNAFFPLLLYKPFQGEGDLKISDDFMSNADTAPLLLAPFGEFKNPYTGHSLDSKAKFDPQILGIGNHKYELHKGVTFMMDRQFTVSEKALDPASWNRVPESDYIGR